MDRPELDVQETCEVYGGKELENGEKEAEGEDDLCLDPTVLKKAPGAALGGGAGPGGEPAARRDKVQAAIFCTPEE